MKDADFIQALRASAPYVHAHNGRVFVIAFGGEAAQRPDFDQMMYDVALLRSLGVKLVLVHGARPQIEQELESRDLNSEYVDGLRVTDPPTLECVKAAVGSLRMEIEARLSTSLASTPMGGARIKVASGNWITARPVGVREGIDMQNTGQVRRVDAQAIRANLDAERVCLVSPVGYSPTGEIFNLRHEDVATEVATALAADKLVFLTSSDPTKGPLAREAGDAGQMSIAAAGKLLKAKGKRLAPDTRSRLESVVAAGRGGVKRVHLTFTGRDGALLRELYTRDGGGMLFYADADYESMREASIDDVGGILALIQPLEESGVLVPRSREQLELEINSFSVMVRDGMVVACAAMFPFTDAQAGELACVVVHPDYRNQGRATALLQRIEKHAHAQGITRLFSLTTHTPHWFVEHGFSQGKADDLPMRKRALYNYQRNSLILVKVL